jgi:catechol 2,3-dioxygenase-like lactoylglutathione lyase family enzyme
LDAAAERYAQLLGSAPTFRGEHPELGTRAVLFGLSNALIELLSPLSERSESEGLKALLGARGAGLYGLSFGTDDAAALFTLLRARGVRAAPPVDGEADDGTGNKRSYRVLELSPRVTRGLSVSAVERHDSAALRAARPDPAAAHALDHVVVRTADPEAAIALYRDGLGLRLSLDRSFGETRMLFFRVGGVTLEVVQDARVGERDALFGLAYRVGDIEAAHARLAQLGFSLSEVRAGNKPGTRVFTVREQPCGVPTLVIWDAARVAQPSRQGG